MVKKQRKPRGVFTLYEVGGKNKPFVVNFKNNQPQTAQEKLEVGIKHKLSIFAHEILDDYSSWLHKKGFADFDIIEENAVEDFLKEYKL
jgi:hypothetical protein